MKRPPMRPSTNRAPFTPRVAPSHRQRSRRGAAFLMLVVLVLLVVVGATHRLVQNEAHTGRAMRETIRRRIMLAAIEQVQQTEMDAQQPWILPLGDGPMDMEDGEFLEVREDDRTGEISVRWLRRGEVMDEMVRPTLKAGRTQ